MDACNLHTMNERVMNAMYIVDPNNNLKQILL